MSLVLASVSIGPLGSSVHAEEAITLEGSAESSVGSAESTTAMIAEDPFFFAFVGRDVLAYLSTTAAVLLTVGGTIMYINNKTELKRRYRDGAAEAAHLKIDQPGTPLAHATPGGSLVKMIELETAVARKANFPIANLNQTQLLDLVIARSKQLEAK